MRRLRFAAAITWFTFGILAGSAPAAEVIYFNADIHTFDAEKARVSALAARDGRIVAIGELAEVERAVQSGAAKIDLGGRFVMPGMIDAHGHLLNLGSFALGKLDLSHAESFDEVIAIVKAKADQTPKGEWIIGGRWDHESWADKKLPTHAALSAATPEHPVWLSRVDGHAGIANAEAMRRNGVSRETSLPAGGEMIRDAAGEPTGVFVDHAMSLITDKIDQKTADTAELLLAAQRHCLELGLTGVHDAGVSPRELEVFQRLADEGRLKLRVYAMVPAREAPAYFAKNPPKSGERLSVRACKVYMDGALGSRGAWLNAPYSDLPADSGGKSPTGLALTTPAEMRAICKDAIARGYQICTHAIGDRANQEVIDAYIETAAESLAERRFRIEHAQVLREADVARIAKQGIIASMQPTHCTSDMRWAEARLGKERARFAYAWRSVNEAGARLALGSDFPVESANPLWGVYAAITRQDHAGQPSGGWNPQEKLERGAAFRGFTISAAYAEFAEEEKGKLLVGRFADFVVVDRDVLKCAEKELIEAKVLRTVIGGETVFERGGS